MITKKSISFNFILEPPIVLSRDTREADLID